MTDTRQLDPGAAGDGRETEGGAGSLSGGTHLKLDQGQAHSPQPRSAALLEYRRREKKQSLLDPLTGDSATY